MKTISCYLLIFTFTMVSGCKYYTKVKQSFSDLPFLNESAKIDSMSLSKLMGKEYSAKLHYDNKRMQDSYWEIVEDPDYHVYEFVKDSTYVFFLEKFLRFGSRPDPDIVKVVDILSLRKSSRTDSIVTEYNICSDYPGEKIIVHFKMYGPVIIFIPVRAWRINMTENRFEEISTEYISNMVGHSNVSG